MATAAGGQTPGAAEIAAVPAEQRIAAVRTADAVCDRGCSNNSSFIFQLEQLLWKIPGAAAVFAALIANCQHSIDAGNGINGSSNSAAAKHGTVDVSCLLSSQELHSAARSLPLLLRLYFTSDSRAEALAQGKSEPLSSKMLERCLASLADCPVVPGQGDAVVCVLDLLSSCKSFQEVLVARKLKLPPGLQHLDDKAWAKLDQNYSLTSKTVSFLQQHDELCDLLSQLALEVKQALAVDRDIDSTAFVKAETLVIGSLNFISSARNALMELDAWRLATSRFADKKTSTAAGGSAVPAPETMLPADRYHLIDMDTVPFIDILAAVTSLAGLMADSEAWLQPLLHEHAVKQLQDIAVHSLPLLAKTYPKNHRVQQLLKGIIDCLQGNLVELPTDRDVIGVAAATHAAPTETQDSIPLLAASGPGPIAEGFEGLVSPVKAVWGKREKLRASSRQEQCKQPPVAGVGSHQAAAAAAAGFGLEAEVDAAEAVVAVAIDGLQQNSSGAAGRRVLDEPAIVQEGSSCKAASSPRSEAPARARKTWVKAIMRSMGSKQAKATGMNNSRDPLLLEELEQLEAELTGAAEPVNQEQPAQCLLMSLNEATPASPGVGAEPAARGDSPQSGDALLGKMQQQPCQAADGPALLHALFAAGSGNAPHGAVEESQAERMTTRRQEQLCQPGDDSNGAAAAAGVLASEDANPGSSSLKLDSITDNHDVNQAAALGGSRSQDASLANKLTSLQASGHSESIIAADKPKQPAASTDSSRAAEGVDGSRTLEGPGSLAGRSARQLLTGLGLTSKLRQATTDKRKGRRWWEAVFWDARNMLKNCGVLELGLPLLRLQEKAFMQSYMQHLVPTMYEHYKAAQEGMPEQPVAAEPRAQEHQVLNQLQQMLQDLRHPGAEEPEQPARQAHDDQQIVCHDMAGSKGPPPQLMSSTLSKSPLRRRHKRRVIPASAAPLDVTVAAEEPGQTPLVQKMERSRGLQAELRGWQQRQLASFVCSCNCMLVDLRQWLSAGLVTALHQDAALLVQRSRCSPANGIVELGVHYAILQRTHQLLLQYMLLPDSWVEVLEAADAEHTGGIISTADDVASCSAKAVVGSIMDVLDTAAYDSEAQVLMLGKENETAAAAGHPKLTGILAEVAAVLQPFRNFFGRQHLASMHAFAGPAGQQLLLSCLLNKLDNQQHLPPALLQLPPADVNHDARTALRYYQQHLSAALSQPGLCAKALQTLQCIGNCLALLQLLSIQQATAATPLFMQVAPLLGVVGRSISDAAAVADCIERIGPPDPISATAATACGSWSWTRSCAAGLLMPETEALEPSERARHAHEMQELRELQQEQAWRLEAHAQGHPFDENLTKPGAEGSARDAFVWYGGCGGQDTPPGLRLESANASPHPTADALGRATAGVQAAKHCRQALSPVADISADAVGSGGQEQAGHLGTACQVVPEEPPQQHVQQATAEPSTELSRSVSSLDLVMTSEDDLAEESETSSAGAAAAGGGAVAEGAAADGSGARPTVVPRLGLLQDTACEALAAAFDVQAVFEGAPTGTPAAWAPQANAAADSTIAGSSDEGLHADALTMFMSGRSEFTFSSDGPESGAPCISRSGTVPGTAVQCSVYAAAPGPGDLLFDSTCHELVRVIDERNKLQSEVVMLRNQLENRDSSLALLRGTLLTPRRRSMEDAEGYETPVLGSTVASAEPSCGGASMVASTAYPSCAGMSPAASATPSAEPSKVEEPSTTHTAAAVKAGCVTGAVGPSSTPAAEQDAGSVGQQGCSPAMPAVTTYQKGQQQASRVAVDELGPAAPSHQASDTRDTFAFVIIAVNATAADLDNTNCRGTDKAYSPLAKANGSNKRQSQVAVALSALKFALLMEVASKGTAAAASAAASGGNEHADAQLSSAANPQDDNTAHAASPQEGTSTGDCPAAGSIASLHASVAVGMQNSGDVVHRVTGSSGSGAGGGYGDGPLLASAVLLQLTGQARLHSLVDATQRIAYWVEYCALRNSGQVQTSCAAASKAPRTATTLPGLGSPPGGIGLAAVNGIPAPKPRSRRRQAQEAEVEERQAQEAAAQQHLLERLAAANRQAENIAADGFSMAARFAPPVPARSQAVQLKVYRVDKAAAAGCGAEAAAAWSQAAGGGEGRRLGRWPSEAASFSSSGGGRAPASSLGGMSSSSAGCGAGKVRVGAVPVKGDLRAFTPAAQPWDGIVPCPAAIQAHPALPMKRPLPLLLPASSRAAGIGDMAALEGAAAGGVLNSAGRLLPGAGVAARGGVVAAARAVHAKEALLASVPKHAAYSFSVVSDHNRSGLMEDGYSKAPSTTDLDNYQEDVHQLLGNRRSGTAAAASAARLGARKAASDLLELQREAGSGLSDLPLRSTSPSKSPGRKQQHPQHGGAHAGPPGGTRGLLVRAATAAGLVPS
eukprot:gene8815-8994_t